MDLGRRIFISRGNLWPFPRSQCLPVRPRAISIPHWSRAFAKGKERAKLKSGNDGTSPKRTVPIVYLQGRKRVEAEYKASADENSKPRFSKKWKIAIFGFLARFLAILFVGIRRLPLKPVWTPHPPREGMSLETLSKKHQKCTIMWKKSAAFQDLLSFFEVMLDDDSIDITACMCLCLGTLSGQSWTSVFDSCDAAMSQLVAFESMVELLREYTETDTERARLTKEMTGTKYKIGKILIQDPSFNALDIQFLQERDFTIVEGPQNAIDSVPPTTFVFLPRATYGVIKRTIEVVNPPLLLVDNLQEISRSPNPKLFSLRPVLLPFLAQRTERTLPHSKLAHWWGQHVIYFKPSSK